MAPACPLRYPHGVTWKRGVIGGVIALAVGVGAFRFLSDHRGPAAPPAHGDRDVPAESTAASEPPRPDDPKAFAELVFDDVQDTFAALMGARYRRAELALYTVRTSAEGCGLNEPATGPFHCPAHQRAYIDLAFFEQLSRRAGASGDLARAYVIAHEIGHHVQHLTGLHGRVPQLAKAERLGADGTSVRLELMADCLAGVWAHGTGQRDLIESGDIEDALRAAASIGGDALDGDATGVVRPETFSHGTLRQRVRWFGKGRESGRVEDCNPFIGHSP